MARLPDWRARLAAYVASVAHMRFAPGRMDCALFAAGAVEAVTGVDYASDYRGRYRTLRGGGRMIKRDGFSDHVEFVASVLPETDPAQAIAGDLVAIDVGGELALGVVQGAMVYVRGPDGVGLVPRALALRAFGVR